MRTLKLALTAVAAFAIGSTANAQAPVVGMGFPPTAIYQPNLGGIPYNASVDGLNFHAGGVASCDGCHVMHNASHVDGSQGAKSTHGISPGEVAWSNHTNAFLLQGSDQSSTCLICHGATAAPATVTFEVATINPAGAPLFYSPGGDFGWLYKNYNNSPAAHHGHSVQAQDYGLVGATNAAPGGTWQAISGNPLGQFACTSCHDPHGRYRLVVNGTGVGYTWPANPSGTVPAGPYPVLPIASTGSYGASPVAASYAVGAYRLLGGQYYQPASNPNAPFASDPPVAVAPTNYNHTEAPGSEVRVAYGTGMSEWCANCHVAIHENNYTSGAFGFAGLVHPAGSSATLTAGQYNVYNTYVSSGNYNTSLTNNYTSLVPFEQGPSATIAQLQALTSPSSSIAAGPTNNVMCLSCHRAHATAFDNIIRWDQNATFLTDGTNVTAGITAAAVVTGGGGVRPTSDTIAGYYGRNMMVAFGPYQRSLCNKCHGKD